MINFVKLYSSEKHRKGFADASLLVILGLIVIATLLWYVSPFFGVGGAGGESESKISSPIDSAREAKGLLEQRSSLNGNGNGTVPPVE